MWEKLRARNSFLRFYDRLSLFSKFSKRKNMCLWYRQQFPLKFWIKTEFGSSKVVFSSFSGVWEIPSIKCRKHRKNVKKRLSCFKIQFWSKFSKGIIDGIKDACFFFLKILKKVKAYRKNAKMSLLLVFLT